MVEVIACIVAVAGSGLSLTLALRLQRMEGRLRIAERELESMTRRSLSPVDAPMKQLEGLRVAIAVTQDHPHPVFANLLKEQFLSEDAAEVELLGSAEASIGSHDILVTGSLACNGYAEVFYQADLTCHGPQGPICTLVERPPHGDRPSNLAIELTTKLKKELEKLSSRNERRDAIRELRGG